MSTRHNPAMRRLSQHLRRPSIVTNLTVVAICVLAMLGPSATTAGASTASEALEATPGLNIAPGQLGLGVDVASGFYKLTPIAAFEALVAHPVNVVQASIGWGYTSNPAFAEFPTYRIEGILKRGSTPEISWGPTVDGKGLYQPEMSLASIYGGRHDAYIRRFAQAARSVGGPLLLRFAPEMNGWWMSYSEQNSGNKPGDFVKAWRHVHEIFEQVGATNVKWIWSPNNTVADAPSLAPLYPGNAYVDWVAVDGYSYPKVGCASPGTVFDPAVQNIESFSDRPMMLAEVGIAAQCSNKPAWIASLFTWLHAHTRIRSITWWDRDTRKDNWSVNSSPQATEAFRQGLAKYGVAGSSGLTPSL